MIFMKILLINPPRFNDLPVIREERCEITERYSILPPYSLLQIASILRNDNNNVRLIDANGWKLNWEQVENQIRKEKYDVLIFRFTPTTFDWDNKVCSISKENQASALTVGICWTLRTLPTQVLDC
jgi:anaerobic magnesium-protoporphyrin IX monomethyl ester cyclase